jgi:hypothetical protein
MSEPTGRSVGVLLGWGVVAAGTILVGLGIVALTRGERPEAVESLLFGGLALVAGLVILSRRKGGGDKEGPGRTD